MARVLTIPVMPKGKVKRSKGEPDPRYVAGQRLLADAISYLARTNAWKNKEAISFLSEHFRTQFRMTDRP